jgi:hypothetical protein
MIPPAFDFATTYLLLIVSLVMIVITGFTHGPEPWRYQTSPHPVMLILLVFQRFSVFHFI